MRTRSEQKREIGSQFGQLILDLVSSDRYHDWDRPEIEVSRVVGPLCFLYSFIAPSSGMAHGRPSTSDVRYIFGILDQHTLCTNPSQGHTYVYRITPSQCRRLIKIAPNSEAAVANIAVLCFDVHCLSLCTLPQMEGGESEQRHHEQFLPQMLLACCMLPRTDAINRISI